MSTTDVIKKSILEGFSYADISTAKIAITLAITFLIAMYIFFVYKYITKSAFYNKSFNVAMAIISMVTAGIVLAMQSSIVISLGMVGALSIVRFRTAIKEPMDLLFLFWSIGTGIICGAGLYKIALMLAILVTISIIILSLLPVSHAAKLLIINSTRKEAEPAIMEIVKKQTRTFKVKSKNVMTKGMDLIIEIRTDHENEMIDEITTIEGISSVSVLSHDGELNH